MAKDSSEILKRVSTLEQGDSSRDIYDDWSGDYDEHLQSEFGYISPGVAASELAQNLARREARIIDFGCGTGLVGKALNEAGFHDVVGVDLSSDSLDLAAQTGAYRALNEIDFTALPTSLPDEHFGALICVGVMTYLADVEAVCREFARIVESDGVIVITQRTDLFESRDTAAAYATLVDDGVWEQIELTDPGPYLPGHSEYDGIDVIYAVFRKA